MRRQPQSRSAALQPVTLSQCWTHFVIGCSLSPRAKKQIKSATDELNIEGLQALGAEHLFIPLLDLGVCHRSNASALKVILQSCAAHHATFKLFGDRFKRAELSAPIGQASQLVSLSLKDRHDQLLLIREELARQVSAKGFTFTNEEGVSTTRAKTSSIELLIGVSGPEGSMVKQEFRGSVWVNDLILLSRPHDYLPHRGYEVEREVKLLTEPPSTSLQHEEHVTTDQARRHDELYDKLNQRLAERAQAYKDHTLNRATEPTSPEPKRRRRHRKRSKPR